MNQLLRFTFRVAEKLLDLYLKIMVAVLGFFGRALARVIADLYTRLTRKPRRPAPVRPRSFERRRGDPRRR
ncbi:hypothetical protein [Rhizobium sp. LCM 4573]|uniref:hypothetical protein n=1 Tax=Rhizobium sp. LCM 4573 TaxID=1848291 RepID=UPI0008D9A821|nr:hypothetical protein [Rhizobium sp. LCM 4573]OHV78403.1 hypothetical protein LCM4573_26670 [Rhizobium sp. LCM 4573]